MTHVTCRLTGKNRDQLGNPTLGNRVWATFFNLCSASYASCLRDVARTCYRVLHCGAVAAERRRLLLIDISGPRGAQQRTHGTPLLLWSTGQTEERTERVTDRRTLCRFIDLAQHIMRAASIVGLHSHRGFTVWNIIIDLIMTSSRIYFINVGVKSSND